MNSKYYRGSSKTIFGWINNNYNHIMKTLSHIRIVHMIYILNNEGYYSGNLRCFARIIMKY